jgi:predicted oxidoreductase
MERIKFSDQVDVSRIVLGVWRLSEWNMSKQDIIGLVEHCLSLGIDTFDHADIYGNYTCEGLFGEALSSQPALNNQLKIVTKCGINLLSDKKPEHYIKHYNTSYDHIIASAENSLRLLRRETLDVLLIHRPDPYMDPEETARAFSDLRQSGKVKEFGVSNFTPSQYSMLASYLDFHMVTNQVELSPMTLDNFENGVTDQCLELRISPMAWSPLGGGSIFSAQTHRILTIKNILHRIADQHDASIDQIMYAWILAHPCKIIPMVGTGKLERITKAAEAFKIQLSRQQWFEIWVAGQGVSVP